MRNLATFRNAAVIIAAVVLAVVALTFLTTLMSSIIPIAVTGVVAFILGRMSVNRDLFGILRGVFSRVSLPAQAEQAAPAAAPKQAEQPAKPVPAKQAEAAAPAAKPKEAAPATKNELLDPAFEVKTPEQIEAEARAREQELLKRKAEPNVDAVQAALEERRKRLLGNQGDGST
ncbi:MAG: hypothetical protein JNJ61_12020 [Anaerolineae bacterium]|nr:hypothetical protein [Anaerolineae bacterium]